MRVASRHLVTLAGLLLLATAARAGMPSPLPTEDDLVRVLRLNGTTEQRLEVISFFLGGLLVSALVVQLLWNAVARDVPRLPRLTFGRALAGVVLWGLLFVIVLTMIAGARELMTPGAWKKQGWTYKVTEESPTGPSPPSLRRRQFERLGTALLQFAATHDGRFPEATEKHVIPSELWDIPESPGLKFLYFPGRSATKPDSMLAYDPQGDTHGRLILKVDGSVTRVSADEFERLRPVGGPP